MKENAIVIVNSTPLELLISAWLDAKAKKSGSAKTKTAYEDTLFQFRAGLKQQGFDLDSTGEAAIAHIVLTAQAFAGYSSRIDKVTGKRKDVAPATINQRLAILSSFYEYATRQGAIGINPIARVERARVQQYAGAQALDTDAIERALDSVPRETLQGKRDYALLTVLLETGHRATETSRLELQHVNPQAGKCLLIFAHCKGNEVMRDTLSYAGSHALAEWLHAYYGVEVRPGERGDSRPVWVALAHDHRVYGKSLGVQSIADICEKYLHTRKIHATRHSFAHALSDIGVPVNEIQAKLGHKSLATTGRYLAALKQAEKPYAEKLSAHLGIK